MPSRTAATPSPPCSPRSSGSHQSARPWFHFACPSAKRASFADGSRKIAVPSAKQPGFRDGNPHQGKNAFFVAYNIFGKRYFCMQNLTWSRLRLLLSFTDDNARHWYCTETREEDLKREIGYLRMLCRISKQLLSICNLIVADAYFSKESFVTGVKELGFNIISRFRDDVNLKYLYRGPKARKRGRPQKFAGKVDLKHLDTDKKTQARKVFFSTNLTISARDIFDIYRTRFQLEFVFRQRCQGLCPAAGTQPFGRFNQNPAAQRCNGGSIYCNVRETRELAIK